MSKLPSTKLKPNRQKQQQQQNKQQNKQQKLHQKQLMHLHQQQRKQQQQQHHQRQQNLAPKLLAESQTNLPSSPKVYKQFQKATNYYPPNKKDLSYQKLKITLGRHFDSNFMSIRNPMRKRNFFEKSKNVYYDYSGTDLEIVVVNGSNGNSNNNSNNNNNNSNSNNNNNSNNDNYNNNNKMQRQVLIKRVSSTNDNKSSHKNVILPIKLPAYGKVFAKKNSLFESYLAALTACPVRFEWVDLGPTFWPRWFKEGSCGKNYNNDVIYNSNHNSGHSGSNYKNIHRANKSLLKKIKPHKIRTKNLGRKIRPRSCSVPNGMTCQRADTAEKIILWWFCRKNSTKKSRIFSRGECAWYKISFVVTISCQCRC
ncbi:hypothetical protein HELRODRAFT_173574 [Helobdella robusta]|uniref:Noggin n=1 Tax=Helobdella robusta TaxID=6412 RepID=T1F6Z3_HELRO|nr:hypothetical protein HELRODRAFT_173574 [Helobdella robusta]ESO03289.1 hypothetical protein HELRODRAFT_173574 [Helobdella robusta]